MIKRYTLTNGMRVIGEALPSYRSVSMGVWIEAGSVYEKEGEHGISHFIEHMLFKGTEKRSAAQIASEMDSVGGSLNAFTAKECTCYHAKVMDKHLGLTADILGDMVKNAVFDEGEMEKEKGVVCDEILMMEDTPEEIVHDLLCAQMYAGSELASPILGTQESVKSFTQEDILSYMAKRYMPNNMLIACAGNYDEDMLIEILEQSFQGFGSGEKGERPDIRRALGKRFAYAKKDIEQAHICIGLPGYAIKEDDQFALLVLNNVIGGSMSSRLFQKIREERGLAYSVYSYPSSYNTTGYFTLYAGTGENQAEEVVKLMLAELDDIREHGISEAELLRAREQFKGSYVLGQESTSARANSIGKSELIRGFVYTEEEIMRKIEGVDMEAVLRIIPHVLDQSAMSGALAGRETSGPDTIQKLIIGE